MKLFISVVQALCLSLTLVVAGVVHGEEVNPSVTVGSAIGYHVSSDDVFLTEGVAGGGMSLIVWSQKKTGEDVFVPYGKLINQSGTVGGAFPVSALPLAGIPAASFDGARFLVAWAAVTGEQTVIYGQFIDTAGALSGAAFEISTTAGEKQVNDIAFTGSQYLVLWTDERSETKDVYGQLVTPSGTLTGSEISIGAGAYNQKDPSVAADSTNFMVVWNDGARLQQGQGEDIVGQIVTPSGSLQGGHIIISQNAYPSDNPMSIVFDGTRYFVVWMEEVGGAGTKEWDLRGQFISSSGSLIGSELIINNKPGGQVFPSVSYESGTYVVVWTDMRNDTNNNGMYDEGEGTGIDIYGQCIDLSGGLKGSEFVITSAAYDQICAALCATSAGLNVFWTDNRTGTHGKYYGLQYGDIYGASIDVDDGTPVAEEHSPEGFSLDQNRPNPFNPSTTITFSIPVSAPVSLDVYSVSGQKIATLASGIISAGSHSVIFDGSGLASGVYYYHLQSSGYAKTGRMLLVK